MDGWMDGLIDTTVDEIQ